MTDAPFRVLPALDDDNRFFWTSGADGQLRFLRCQACGYYLQPPGPRCPECWSRDLVPEAVSGRAEVHTFTVNHHPWDGSPEPYVIAIVTFPEQGDLRLTTNVVGCAPDEVHIGMPVQVTFEQHDDIYFPLFEPEAELPARAGGAGLAAGAHLRSGDGGAAPSPAGGSGGASAPRAPRAPRATPTSSDDANGSQA